MPLSGHIGDVLGWLLPTWVLVELGTQVHFALRNRHQFVLTFFRVVVYYIARRTPPVFQFIICFLNSLVVKYPNVLNRDDDDLRKLIHRPVLYEQPFGK